MILAQNAFFGGEIAVFAKSLWQWQSDITFSMQLATGRTEQEYYSNSVSFQR